MTIRIKISDGVREVEVEAPGEDVSRLSEVEAAAQRMYSVVAPDSKKESTPAGFGGWSTLSDHERQPEEWGLHDGT